MEGRQEEEENYLDYYNFYLSDETDLYDVSI